MLQQPLPPSGEGVAGWQVLEGQQQEEEEAQQVEQEVQVEQQQLLRRMSTSFWPSKQLQRQRMTWGAPLELWWQGCRVLAALALLEEESEEAQQEEALAAAQGLQGLLLEGTEAVQQLQGQSGVQPTMLAEEEEEEELAEEPQ